MATSEAQFAFSRTRSLSCSGGMISIVLLNGVSLYF